MRRFAADTTVPMARSRGEIDRLLREWGAEGVQWTDDYANDLVRLRFVWPREGQRYMARFDVHLPSRAQIEADELARKRKLSRWSVPEVSETRMSALLGARGRAEHRVLLLWIKAALNAVASGIVSAEAVFLPFLEGADGRTVADVALPQLAALASGAADRLLPAPPGRGAPR